MDIKLISEIPENSNLLDVEWGKDENTIKGNELDNVHWATLNADVLMTFADGKSYKIPRYYLYQIYNDKKLKDELYDDYKLTHFYNFRLDHKTVIENSINK
tara:strand:+ start:138 stop:440 length:303 start_codon:yes stop_codon:yes gene_type:complete